MRRVRPLRVICTGSRKWRSVKKIRDILESLAAEFLGYGQKRSELTIVHGGCPKGADAIVDREARALGYTVEVFPAERGIPSPRCFYYRNQTIVDHGARLCLAFWVPGGSFDSNSNAMDKADARGTGDTFTRAAAANIPVRIWTEPAEV